MGKKSPKKASKKTVDPTKPQTESEEQRDFEICEENHLELIRKCEKLSIIEKTDVDTMNKAMKTLLPQIPTFSAPFIEAYNIVPTVRKLKRMLAQKGDNLKHFA